MNDSNRQRRAHLIAPEFLPYLDGTGSTLALPHCSGCERTQWPPRPACTECGGLDFTPRPAAAVGSLYSWTTTHRATVPEYADLVPYTVVIVALDENPGVRLLGRLAVTRDLSQLTVGTRMRGTWATDIQNERLLTWRVDG